MRVVDDSSVARNAADLGVPRCASRFLVTALAYPSANRRKSSAPSSSFPRIHQHVHQHRVIVRDGTNQRVEGVVRVETWPIAGRSVQRGGRRRGRSGVKKRTNASSSRRRAPRADAPPRDERRPRARRRPRTGRANPVEVRDDFVFRPSIRFMFRARRRVTRRSTREPRRRQARPPAGRIATGKRRRGRSTFVLRRFVFRPAASRRRGRSDARPSATRRAREARDSHVRDMRRGRMRRATNRASSAAVESSRVGVLFRRRPSPFSPSPRPTR